jgi:hypothetical protein
MTPEPATQLAEAAEICGNACAGNRATARLLGKRLRGWQAPPAVLAPYGSISRCCHS